MSRKMGGGNMCKVGIGCLECEAPCDKRFEEASGFSLADIDGEGALPPASERAIIAGLRLGVDAYVRQVEGRRRRIILGV